MANDIDAANLDAAREALAHWWEMACVVSLANGPMRYVQLSRAVRAWSKVIPMPEAGVLSRTLPSLEDKGLIRRAGTGRSTGWELTEAGVEHLDYLARISAAAVPEQRSGFGEDEGG